MLNAKPPPILSKRIEVASSQFPVEVTIDDSLDSTLEGKQLEKKWKSGDLPLLFSARLDEDGTASTRSPNDLIGQATVKYVGSEWERFEIVLGGRGVAGKFITAPNK